MALLTDRRWELKYTPEDGDLVAKFYVPVLRAAVQYDRSTGFFSATALALAARGITGLVENGGVMRLLVGCTLEQPEIDAITRGEDLRAAVGKHVSTMPLVVDDGDAEGALELLAWLVEQGRLSVKVAIPCDTARRPVAGTAIFHEKAGIVRDAAGNRLAWNGSLNETAHGWRQNWESINIFTSWQSPDRVQCEEANFARIWEGNSPCFLTVDIPSAVRDELLRFLPRDGQPPRLLAGAAPVPAVAAPPRPAPGPSVQQARRALWEYIAWCPQRTLDGEAVGEATAAVEPWPHQRIAFQRMYRAWPPRLLIADEVGLGKTIEAGLLLRQAWLAGRLRRVLILAPKNVLPQWQLELREKFNLNWPIYDGKSLTWLTTPAAPARFETPDAAHPWHAQPVVIMSSHLARRRERRAQFLQEAQPWDLVLLDEAHHARRQAASGNRRRPNELLRLMEGLQSKTQGLVLLTGTPMQVHPVEVWDLLQLLGLPPEWNEDAFLKFFEVLHAAESGSVPSHEQFERMCGLFRASEAAFRPMSDEMAMAITGLTRIAARGLMRALRGEAQGPRRELTARKRQAAMAVLKHASPVRLMISRYTRALLRRYAREGKLDVRIADRAVQDEFLEMSADERALYEAVERYISHTYNAASQQERSAVGFVMTIYQRRLASSLAALAATLAGRLAAMDEAEGPRSGVSDEDAPDDDSLDEQPDLEQMSREETIALRFEERSALQELLAEARRLPADTKATALRDLIAAWRRQGYAQVMVFTQYTATMDFLRDHLLRAGAGKVLCYSGRGGEVVDSGGAWITVSRDEAKRRFKSGEADILLCTDAAGEGLNFQFCGALINYDMPWNPMRVEQRIGRIDRLGQSHGTIQVANLHYKDTVEADVYAALRQRIRLFETHIGRVQPILARLPSAIQNTVLAPRREFDADRLVDQLAAQAKAEPGLGLDDLDPDDAAAAELWQEAQARPAIDLKALDLLLQTAAALPPSVEVSGLGAREYSYQAPGMPRPVRVTTDPAYYEANAGSTELWSPGTPIFPQSPPEPDAVKPSGLEEVDFQTLLRPLRAQSAGTAS